MRIAGVEIRRAPKEAPAPATNQAPPRNPNAERVEVGERGFTGSPIWGGSLAEVDYNARMASSAAYDEYDKMRLSDGQVKAALTVLKLPLLNADWHIEPASDSAEDREIAEFIERNLRDGMSISWFDFLRQTLLMLDYGSIAFEKVWEIRGGLVRLRKLAPRLPRSIIEWQVDRGGGLSAITQAAASEGGYQQVEIPAAKLCVFVNDLEGSNYRGTSVLRAAWKHWFMKSGLEKLQCMGLEKRTLGVDVGTLKGEGITPTDKANAERALMTLHAHEKQFFLEVEDQLTYRLEGANNTGGTSPQSAIEYHDLRIVRALITEFLAMGSGSTGSLAMHKDKTSMMMLALGGHANNITATLDRYLIRQWVNYNWSVKEYPRLRYSRLEARDLEPWVKMVAQALQTGMLTPTPDIQSATRDMLDLPAFTGLPDEDMGGLPPGPAQTEAVAAVWRRQTEKLADWGERIFAGASLDDLLRVSVPYRAEMIEALEGDTVEAAASAAYLKGAFMRVLKRQLSDGKFDRTEIEAL